MEKRSPAYKLQSLKQSFLTVDQIGGRITSTAFRDARELGYSREDIVAAIQSLTPKDFCKSMTSYYDHKIWQDVYNFRFKNTTLYMKFTVQQNGNFLILSFKEK